MAEQERDRTQKKTELVILPPPRAEDPIVAGTGGKYRVVRLLGRGAMSSVYLAEQVTMARPVALKILSRDLSADPESVDRFLREARACARLNHPNIAAAIDFGEYQHRFFLAMEYVDGEPLSAVLARDGAQEERRVAEIGLQVVSALKHANAQGVLHLDVKPHNIMISGDDGSVKLADFGLAVVLDHPGTAEASRQAAGTPYYMAPEQIEGGRLDWRTDQYSLGATLYEAATGRKPFTGKSVPDILVKRFFEKPEPAWRAGRRVGKGFSAVLAKMLSRSPDGRYQSFDDLEADFHSVLGGAKPLVAAMDASPAVPSGAGWSASGRGAVTDRVDGMLREKRWNWVIHSSLLFLVLLAIYALVHGRRLAGPAPASVRQDLVAESELPLRDVSGQARAMWSNAYARMLQAEREPTEENLRRAMQLFRLLADDRDLSSTAYGTAARIRAAQLEEDLNMMRGGK